MRALQWRDRQSLIGKLLVRKCDVEQEDDVFYATYSEYIAIGFTLEEFPSKCYSTMEEANLARHNLMSDSDACLVTIFSPQYGDIQHVTFTELYDEYFIDDGGLYKTIGMED